MTDPDHPPVQLTEWEALLSRLLFEAGERVHTTHAIDGPGFTTIVTCQTSNLCQRIMAALIGQMERTS
jgi:hypothetical protein